MSVVNSRLIRSANFSLFGLEDFSLSPESIVVFALCFLRDFCCACANSSEPRSVRTSVPRISYSESAPTMPERDASRGSRPPLSTVRASGSSGRWTAVASLLLPTHVEIVLRFPVDDVARRPLGKFQLPRLLAVTDVR